MLKKVNILIILTIFLPINVFAYELTCDEGNYDYDQTFNCVITGDVENYDRLSGTIEYDDSLDCQISSYSSALSKQTSSMPNIFMLSGQPNSNELLNISCRIKEKLNESKSVIVAVKDFTYHINESGVDEKQEILKSSYVYLNTYNFALDEVETDTKPRSTANPDSRLKTLYEENLKLNFSQFVTEYNIEVLYEVENLDLKYTLNNTNATINIEGNTKLELGENVIDLYVTSPDGSSTTCYTLNVTRLEKGEEIYYLQSDSSLSSMTIKGYSIKFAKDKYDYSIHLDNKTSSINIIAEATNPASIINISPTDNLKNGSIVTVAVKAEDETNETVYKINITKDAPKKDYTNMIILGGGTLVIIVIMILFMKSSQKKKDKDPILKLKKKNVVNNKGKKFDDSLVSEVGETTPVATLETPLTENIPEQGENVNTINLNNSNVVAPTPTEKVQIESFNQAIPVNPPTTFAPNDTTINNNQNQN